jgi:hypothetical protein
MFQRKQSPLPPAQHIAVQPQVLLPVSTAAEMPDQRRRRRVMPNNLQRLRASARAKVRLLGLLRETGRRHHCSIPVPYMSLRWWSCRSWLSGVEFEPSLFVGSILWIWLIRIAVPSTLTSRIQDVLLCLWAYRETPAYTGQTYPRDITMNTSHLYNDRLWILIPVLIKVPCIALPRPVFVPCLELTAATASAERIEICPVRPFDNSIANPPVVRVA